MLATHARLDWMTLFFFCFFGNFPCMPMHICNAISTTRPSRAIPLPRSTSPAPTLFLLPATVPHRRGRRRRWQRLRFLQVKEEISGGLKTGFWVAVAATRWWRQVRRRREKSVGRSERRSSPTSCPRIMVDGVKGWERVEGGASRRLTVARRWWGQGRGRWRGRQRLGGGGGGRGGAIRKTCAGWIHRSRFIGLLE